MIYCVLFQRWLRNLQYSDDFGIFHGQSKEIVFGEKAIERFKTFFNAKRLRFAQDAFDAPSFDDPL